jgi:hypothetical protein
MFGWGIGSGASDAARLHASQRTLGALGGAGVFPGIGVPPVAVSCALAAHRFVSAAAQRQLLEKLELVS